MFFPRRKLTSHSVTDWYYILLLLQKNSNYEKYIHSHSLFIICIVPRLRWLYTIVLFTFYVLIKSITVEYNSIAARCTSSVFLNTVHRTFINRNRYFFRKYAVAHSSFVMLKRKMICFNNIKTHASYTNNDSLYSVLSAMHSAKITRHNKLISNLL
jgi:hypothetical protein